MTNDVSARLARALRAKMGAHKKNGTSLVRTRTPSALVRAWRASSAHAKAQPVPFAVARNE